MIRVAESPPLVLDELELLDRLKLTQPDLAIKPICVSESIAAASYANAEG
jgi:hypothetical protein